MALAHDTLTARRFGRLRVLVTSTSFDAVNRNYLIRDYLTAGFRGLEDGPETRSCPLEIAGTVIAEFSPDLVLAVGSVAADEADLRSLAWQCRRAKARLAYWLHDDPYEFDYSFKAVGYADHVFTNDRWALAHYGGISASHLPMAASREVHHRPLRPMAERDLDLFFCGVGFANRIDLLARAQASLAGRIVEVRGAEWPASLAFARNERLSGAEMADRSARARFTLNVGRNLDIANQRYRLPASTPGPRTFETALSGSAQLFFAAGAEIGDHFEPDAEIRLFDNAGEIEEALARADREPDAVLAMAERAQARALSAHTYDHRALAILDTLFA